jgi:Uma2 family endonuclease
MMGGMTTQSPSRVMLTTTSWNRYVAVIQAAGQDNPGLRIAFGDATMEIMSPSFEHERVVRLIEFLVLRAFDLSGADAISAGSTTYRRDEIEKGAEPDLCFYVNRPNVRLSRHIDLAIDPPPDLVIEIDISRERMSELGIYAGLGVPEMWRFDGNEFAVMQLTGAEYQVAESSALLPWLPLAEPTSRIRAMRDVSNAALRLEWDDCIHALLAARQLDHEG